MKSKLLNFIAILLLMLIDNTVKGIWPLVIIIYYLFTHVHIQLTQENSKFWKHSIWTFIFLMSWKFIYLNGTYNAFHNLFNSMFPATICFFIVFAIESFFPSLISMLFSIQTNSKLKKILKVGTLVFSINYFKSIWLPQGMEIPLSQSEYFLASYYYLSSLGVVLIVSFCLATFILLKSKKYRAISVMLIVSIALLGGWRVSQKKRLNLQSKFILIQTNQSELKGAEKPTPWKLIKEELKKVRVADKMLVFPEYTVKENDPYFQDFIDYLKVEFKKFDLLIGVEGFSNGKIKNEIWYLTERGLQDKYLKTISFPIGERELKIPFLPKQWLKPRFEVALGTETKVFETRKGRIIPIICYEATVSEHYKKIVRNEKNLIYMNFSKDSFLESTNLLKWFDQYVRLKTSEYGINMIRIGTNSSTGHINEYGQYSIKSSNNKFEILEF